MSAFLIVFVAVIVAVVVVAVLVVVVFLGPNSFFLVPKNLKLAGHPSVRRPVVCKYPPFPRGIYMSDPGVDSLSPNRKAATSHRIASHHIASHRIASHPITLRADHFIRKRARQERRVVQTHAQTSSSNQSTHQRNGRIL